MLHHFARVELDSCSGVSVHVARGFGDWAHLTSSLSLVHETGLAHSEHANHQAMSLWAAVSLRNRDTGILKAEPTLHFKPMQIWASAGFSIA